MDRWYEHPKYKGYYANSSGEVWSDKSNKKLKGTAIKTGYTRYVIVNKITFLCHIFVYECFNKIIVNTKKYHIDHINSDNKDNRILNLQKLTVSKHMIKTSSRNNKKAGITMSKPILRYI